jgi:HD-GYP domain-containing protein (c-di-GMP phosphodiesterase class II)
MGKGNEVREITGLLTSLADIEDPTRRIEMVLEWALAELPAQGIALLGAGAEPGKGLQVIASVGTLDPSAERIAAAWSQGALPRERGLVALPASAGNAGLVLLHPVRAGDSASWSALVIGAREIATVERKAHAALLLTSSLLHDALDRRSLQASVERETVLTKLLAAEHAGPAELPGLSLLAEGLHLPVYICDARGGFRYVSPAFLSMAGHGSLDSLTAQTGFFADPGARADELATAKIRGKVESFPLSVVTRSGSRRSIQDSVVASGDAFFGVFFDVTALVAANAELKDALQVQELLNDSIMAGTKTLRRTQGAAIRTLARLAEYRDPETGFHLQRICEYSRLLAHAVRERSPYSFRVTREYGDDISVSCMLHDIGKVSIPDSILLKPGKLAPEEWELMKKHTIFGWEVLHKADRELGEQSFLTLAAIIALSHHEKYDGSGYPNGSAGENIPLSARISALADVYDALTTERPYKQAWSHEQATEEMLKQSGTHFDPVLMDIFRELNPQFAEVRLQFPG